VDDLPILAAIVRAGVVIIEGNGRSNAGGDVKVIDRTCVVGRTRVAVIAANFPDKTGGFTCAVFGVADPGFTHGLGLLFAAIVIVPGRFADAVSGANFRTT